MSTSLFPNSSHYQMLMNGLRTLNDAQPEIAKAKACGIDTSEFEAGHAYLSDQINGFLQHYFPNQLLPPTGANVPHTPE